MMDKPVSICAVGDLILDQPGPMEPYFVGVKDVLTSADILIGHVETPHTQRYQPSCVDIQAPPSPPEHLKVLADLGFDIATTAGNHTYDCGPFGVTDTVDTLRSLGIRTAGSGADLREASRVAVVEKNGLRVGLICFNATGPRFGWATSVKPGANYVDVLTVYQPAFEMPHAPAKIYSFMEPSSEQRMRELIRRAKEDVDVLIVSFHKGAGGTKPFPGWLATYEVPMCHAAVEAGADIILGCHHHMLKGIEFYNGKPIFHGLGNFVTVTYALTPGYNKTEEMIAYMKQREREGRGKAAYDPPYYPWGPESRLTMAAALLVDRSGCVKCGFVPCRIDEKAAVRTENRNSGGQEIFDFVKSLSRDMGFDTVFRWSEDGRIVWAEAAK